jgi:hypothetical protein
MTDVLRLFYLNLPIVCESECTVVSVPTLPTLAVSPSSAEHKKGLSRDEGRRLVSEKQQLLEPYILNQRQL